MVSTLLYGRDIDTEMVSIVFNYDMPGDNERLGKLDIRTGVQHIFNETPQTKQVLMLGATLAADTYGCGLCKQHAGPP